jgi:hypothetical protein
VRAAYDAAEKQKAICEDQRWPISATAKKVVLWLERFKSVGDVASNADPVNAGLPWAGMKFVLTVLVADINQMTALMDGMNVALGAVNLLRAYHEYFRQLPAGLTTENLRNELVEMYALVLRFFAQAIRVYSSNTALRKIQAVWQESEIKSFESAYIRVATKVDTAAHNCDRHLQAQHRQNAARWKSDLDATLKILGDIAGLGLSLDMLRAKVDLSKLMAHTVPSATFNSLEESRLSKCLGGTRVDLLRVIINWTTEPSGKRIFWLCGKAGTGKSTISRTVASMLLRHKTLGASFFFKRGHAGRGNADRFFTTLVAQLSDLIPALRKPVADVLDADSFICSRGLQEQFDRLLREPLESLGPIQLPRDYITIVIDALDECDRKDIRKFLNLLASVHSITGLRLRLFVTSRPELPIEIGFQNIDGQLHEDVFLEEVQKLTIEADLRTYFIHEFAKMRRESLHPPLPPEWPSSRTIDDLVKLAVPLFIFAATVCRFVSEESPRQRLEGILSQQHAVSSLRFANDYTHLCLIYSQILQQVSQGSSGQKSAQRIEQIKSVVGPIILAADPLSVEALSSLVEIDIDIIQQVLARLKSVLNVPQDISQPVQTLHLSFREFLLDTTNEANSELRIDEKQTNADFARQCLQLLVHSKKLRQDICEVGRPGCRRDELTEMQVARHLPRDIAYACMYWPHHFIASGEPLTDDILAATFLSKFFLFWLEAMSWLGKYNLIISSITDLIEATKVKLCSQTLGIVLTDVSSGL